MANKKHIVIKVKYPSPEGQTKDITPSPEIITEWNIKRIVSALAVFILLISLALYFVIPQEKDSDASSSQMSENQSISETKRDAVAEQGKTAEPETASLSASAANDRTSNPPFPIDQPEAGKEATPQETAKGEENDGKEPAAAVSTPSEKKLNKKRKQAQVIRSFLAHKIINKEPVNIINSTVKVGKTKSVWVNYFTELKGMNNKAVYHEWLHKGRILYRQRLNISSNRWRAASRKLFNAKSAGTWLVRTVDEKGRLLDQREFKIISEH
jgi:hypothetical protein